MTGGFGVRQEKEGCEDVEAGSGPRGLDHATVADAVGLAVLDQSGGDVFVKVEGMIK